MYTNLDMIDSKYRNYLPSKGIAGQKTIQTFYSDDEGSICIGRFPLRQFPIVCDHDVGHMRVHRGALRSPIQSSLLTHSFEKL